MTLDVANLTRAIERLGDTTELSVVRVPVGVAVRAERLLSRFPTLDATYWAEPGGYEQVGLDAVEVLAASGAGRFTALSEQGKALFARLAGDRTGLRLFGGFAFQSGRASSELWSPFGEARFSVPRVAYQRSGETAELLLIVGPDELERARTLALATELFAALVDERETVDVPPSSAPRLSERPDHEHLDLVRAICRSIEQGELEKVVLARRVNVALSGPFDAARVLRRLHTIAPECVRFAFRSRGSTFLGATPERLVLKRGLGFETEALAGSIRIDEATHRLLESAKERAEHAIVVREVKRALEPIAESIESAPVPELHRLKHVAHLRTHVRGTLRGAEHVLTLVERLHPTPAVGGVPRARALAFIAEHEPEERGWYAGPVGWFDTAGDGEFAVALRSGVFSGNQGALYAGGGIVAGSDPESELAETRWKLAALSTALE